MTPARVTYGRTLRVYCGTECVPTRDRSRAEPTYAFGPPWCIHCATCGDLCSDPHAIGYSCWFHGDAACPAAAPLELVPTATLWLRAFRDRHGGDPSDAQWESAARAFGRRP